MAGKLKFAAKCGLWGAKTIGHGAVGSWHMGKAAAGSGRDLIANVTISDAELDKLQDQLRIQRRRYEEIVETNRQRYDLWNQPDAICVGGTTLADLAGGWWIIHPTVPADIDKAYALAYPGLAEKTPFWKEAREVMSDPERARGLANGIQGKLFEMQYVEELNADLLPEGLHANLAAAANQPGWDVQITDSFGHVQEQLQLKAVESVKHVKAALEHYPHIPVVTTDEVYQHLLLGGAADHLINSGMLNEQLADHAATAIDSQMPHDHWIPEIAPFLPVTTMALAAFTTYAFDNESSPMEKTAKVGERVGVSWPAFALAHIPVSLFPPHMLTMACAVTTGWAARYYIGRGRERRMIYQDLLRSRATNESILKGLTARVDRFKAKNSLLRA